MQQRHASMLSSLTYILALSLVELASSTNESAKICESG